MDVIYTAGLIKYILTWDKYKWRSFICVCVHLLYKPSFLLEIQYVFVCVIYLTYFLKQELFACNK